MCVCVRACSPSLGLGFSVAVFEVLAVLAIGIFFVRRKTFGYELGGRGKGTHAAVFALFWVLFIVLCSVYVTGGISFGA